ncbi:MAG TPA: hypothetical protein PLX92_07400 [Anaerolineaceae bacterium]|jgi:hypothetical protein|nr:hypothetical protein [Anaerolineaceae bacterium]
MGRTIASITQTWLQEEAALKRFERALRKDDQLLLEELLVRSRQHLAEASYASNLYPLDMYLIAILLEVYKELKALQRQAAQAEPTSDPQAQLNSGKEARFLQLLNETLESFAPQETLELAAESPQAVPADLSVSVSYTAFEEAP